MPTTEDRFIITANARTTEIVITLGDVEVAVKMPSGAPGVMKLGEEQLRHTVLRQLHRVLEVGRQELD